MSDSTGLKDPVSEASSVNGTASADEGASFSERYGEVVGKINDTLDQVDWNQMGRIGKIVGIFAAVIVAQILIKGILDTINLLPVVPGLLELLGLGFYFREWLMPSCVDGTEFLQLYRHHVLSVQKLESASTRWF